MLGGIEERAVVDIDSLLRPVYGHAKQGASFGHPKIANRQVLRRDCPRWSPRSGPRRRRPNRTGADYRAWIRGMFRDLAADAGSADPGMLATHLQLIYDGAGLAARMDRRREVATLARAARARCWTRSFRLSVPWMVPTRGVSRD